MKRAIHIFMMLSMGLLLVVGLLLWLRPAAATALTAPDQTQVIDTGLAYIKSQQEPSGGITGFSGVADPDTTARSVLAFVAAGMPVSEMVSLGGNSMMDYLATQAITFTHDTTGTLFPGRAGELLAAVMLPGGDAKTFGGMDLVSELEATFQADTGAYSTTAKQDFSSGAASDLNQAWALLGLSLARQSVPPEASQYLIHSQAGDGSWGAGDPDTTALAVTALLSGGKITAQDATIQKALGFFHATQLDSGGWKPSWDTDPLNADSTGWILQALATAGEDPSGTSWTKNNTNPVDALSALQKPDGSIGGTYANTYSTAEAIIGLAGVPLSSLGESPKTSRAGLAIFSGDNSLLTDCISFTGSTISGLDLLQRSGLAVETATNPTQGTAVCKIGDVGDTASNCFGSMPNYWAYFVMGANGWEYSAVGADQSQVVDGGVYAWSWGTGNPPPALTFQNTCEGVAFVLPTSTASAQLAASTVSSATSGVTAQPSQEITLEPILATPQPTPSPAPAATSTGTYIIYGVIVLVLAGLVIYFVRGRGR